MKQIEEIETKNGFELKKDTFFLTDTGKSKWVYQNRSDAVKMLKDSMMNGNNAKVFVVNTEGEQWSINQVSWEEIAKEFAMELIRAEKEE